jgi:hypothetical protein
MPTCFPLPPSPGSSRDARDVDAVSTEDLTIEAVIGVATPVSNIATIAREKPPQKKEREKKNTHTQKYQPPKINFLGFFFSWNSKEVFFLASREWW